MRPMTAREALRIERDYPGCADAAQARRILDALVATRELDNARWIDDSRAAWIAWIDAKDKLAALERGEEPKE